MKLETKDAINNAIETMIGIDDILLALENSPCEVTTRQLFALHRLTSCALDDLRKAQAEG